MCCIYNVAWRGLTALLILDWGQCEGLNTGMGESRNSHAFFVSVNLNQLLIAEFGSSGGAIWITHENQTYFIYYVLVADGMSVQ